MYISTKPLIRKFQNKNFLQYIKENMVTKHNFELSDLNKISELKNILFDLKNNPNEAVWLSIYEAAKTSGYSRHNIRKFVEKDIVRQNQDKQVLKQDVDLVKQLKEMFDIFKNQGTIKDAVHPDSGAVIYEYAIKASNKSGKFSEQDTQLMIALRKTNVPLMKEIIANL